MTPILCKRPSELLPKPIGEAHVLNFFSHENLLAVITANGALYLAYEAAAGCVFLRDDQGRELGDGPCRRFLMLHLDALRKGAIPARLSSVQARKPTTKSE